MLFMQKFDSGKSNSMTTFSLAGTDIQLVSKIYKKCRIIEKKNIYIYITILLVYNVVK